MTLNIRPERSTEFEAQGVTQTSRGAILRRSGKRDKSERRKKSAKKLNRRVRDGIEEPGAGVDSMREVHAKTHLTTFNDNLMANFFNSKNVSKRKNEFQEAVPRSNVTLMKCLRFSSDNLRRRLGIINFVEKIIASENQGQGRICFQFSQKENFTSPIEYGTAGLKWAPLMLPTANPPATTTKAIARP